MSDDPAWLADLPAGQHRQARRILTALEHLGCPDPHGWAMSALREDVTQLARAVAYETVFAMLVHLADPESTAEGLPSWTLAEGRPGRRTDGPDHRRPAREPAHPRPGRSRRPRPLDLSRIFTSRDRLDGCRLP